MSRWHWILLVIVPKWNKVIYLDSLVDKNHDFPLVQKVLDRYAHFLYTVLYCSLPSFEMAEDNFLESRRSFSAYVAEGGADKGSSAKLQHRT